MSCSDVVKCCRTMSSHLEEWQGQPLQEKQELHNQQLQDSKSRRIPTACCRCCRQEKQELQNQQLQHSRNRQIPKDRCRCCRPVMVVKDPEDCRRVETAHFADLGVCQALRVQASQAVQTSRVPRVPGCQGSSEESMENLYRMSAYNCQYLYSLTIQLVG